MRPLARGRSHVPPVLQQLPTSGTGWKNELTGGLNNIISCFPAALLRRDIRTASLALALAPVKASGPTDDSLPGDSAHTATFVWVMLILGPKRGRGYQRRRDHQRGRGHREGGATVGGGAAKRGGATVTVTILKAEH